MKKIILFRKIEFQEQKVLPNNLFGTPACHRQGTPVSTWKNPHRNIGTLSGTEGSCQLLTRVPYLRQVGVPKRYLEEFFVLRVYLTVFNVLPYITRYTSRGGLRPLWTPGQKLVMGPLCECNFVVESGGPPGFTYLKSSDTKISVSRNCGPTSPLSCNM